MAENLFNESWGRSVGKGGLLSQGGISLVPVEQGKMAFGCDGLDFPHSIKSHVLKNF